MSGDENPKVVPKTHPCSSCGAPMIWAQFTKKDGSTVSMCYDAEPHPEGTVQLYRKPDGKYRAEYIAPRDRAGHPKLRRVHWSTCPNADQHRKE